MFQTTFIAVGFMALGITALATLNRFDEATKVIWSGAGAVFWTVWALQAGNVETVSGGVVVSSSYDSLLYVGLAFASILLLALVMRSFEVIQENFNT